MQLKDLQDRHKDQPIFVSGAGPSLHDINIDLFDNHIVIAVNSSIVKFAHKATYFLSDDIGAKNFFYYTNLLPTLPCINLLFENKLKLYAGHLNPNRTIFFKHKTWFCPKEKKYYPEGLVLTKDAEKPIIGARTSMGSALHLAYIMGGNPIVLLGCDCSYAKNSPRKRYFHQMPGEPGVHRSTGEPLFAMANAGIRNGYPIDSHCRDFLAYWDAFVEQNRNTTDLHIINASGGILEVFERMPLEDVLEKYHDQRKENISSNPVPEG